MASMSVFSLVLVREGTHHSSILYVEARYQSCTCRSWSHSCETLYLPDGHSIYNCPCFIFHNSSCLVCNCNDSVIRGPNERTKEIN